jgi:hypothetical protein
MAALCTRRQTGHVAACAFLNFSAEYEVERALVDFWPDRQMTRSIAHAVAASIGSKEASASRFNSKSEATGSRGVTIR